MHFRRLRGGLKGAVVRCKPLVVTVGHVDLGMASPAKLFHRHVVHFRAHRGRSPAHVYDWALDVLVRGVHL